MDNKRYQELLEADRDSRLLRTLKPAPRRSRPVPIPKRKASTLERLLTARNQSAEDRYAQNLQILTKRRLPLTAEFLLKKQKRS